MLLIQKGAAKKKAEKLKDDDDDEGLPQPPSHCRRGRCTSCSAAPGWVSCHGCDGGEPCVELGCVGAEAEEKKPRKPWNKMTKEDWDRLEREAEVRAPPRSRRRSEEEAEGGWGAGSRGAVQAAGAEQRALRPREPHGLHQGPSPPPPSRCSLRPPPRLPCPCEARERGACALGVGRLCARLLTHSPQSSCLAVRSGEAWVVTRGRAGSRGRRRGSRR